LHGFEIAIEAPRSLLLALLLVPAVGTVMVVRSLPSPRAAQPVRASGLLFSKRGDRTITRDTYQVRSWRT